MGRLGGGRAGQRWQWAGVGDAAWRVGEAGTPRQEGTCLGGRRGRRTGQGTPPERPAPRGPGPKRHPTPLFCARRLSPLLSGHGGPGSRTLTDAPWVPVDPRSLRREEEAVGPPSPEARCGCQSPLHPPPPLTTATRCPRHRVCLRRASLGHAGRATAWGCGDSRSRWSAHHRPKVFGKFANFRRAQDGSEGSANA